MKLKKCYYKMSSLFEGNEKEYCSLIKYHHAINVVQKKYLTLNFFVGVNKYKNEHNSGDQ